MTWSDIPPKKHLIFLWQSVYFRYNTIFRVKHIDRIKSLNPRTSQHRISGWFITLDKLISLTRLVDVYYILPQENDRCDGYYSWIAIKLLLSVIDNS